MFFLLFAVAGVFGQSGVFGPVATRLSAGDFAPDLVFSKVLSADGATSSSVSLLGQVTVLAFFPDTSHNPQSAERWNALIDRYAGRPVQFVWITAEDDRTLAPWLNDHPLKGLVVRDANGETARAFGMETPEGVIIGPARKILGYDAEIVPTERIVDAALEGRITTTPPQSGTAAFQEFVESRRVLLQAQPRPLPRPGEHKPDVPPSLVLHVSPSDGNGGNFAGDDFQSFQDYDLKDVLAALYSMNRVRVHLPASLDDGKRYNFAVVLPKPESRESIFNRMRQGVQDYFHVAIARESQNLDAYVVTLADKRPPAAKPQKADEDLSFTDSYSVEYQVASPHGEFPEPPKAVRLADVRGIAVEGAMDKFCRALEASVDRPVVNESNLSGDFAIDVKVPTDSENDFLYRLRTQTGIVITPAQRNVEILTVKLR